METARHGSALGEIAWRESIGSRCKFQDKSHLSWKSRSHLVRNLFQRGPTQLKSLPTIVTVPLREVYKWGPKEWEMGVGKTEGERNTWERFGRNNKRGEAHQWMGDSSRDTWKRDRRIRVRPKTPSIGLLDWQLGGGGGSSHCPITHII